MCQSFKICLNVFSLEPKLNNSRRETLGFTISVIHQYTKLNSGYDCICIALLCYSNTGETILLFGRSALPFKKAESQG